MVSKLVTDWEARGRRITVDGLEVFVLDAPPTGPEIGRPVARPPRVPDLLVRLARRHRAGPAAGRRVVLFDFLGFGLSDKPDVRYSIRGYADTTEAVAAAVGLDASCSSTHDLGDSVGGEILARVARSSRSSSRSRIASSPTAASTWTSCSSPRARRCCWPRPTSASTSPRSASIRRAGSRAASPARSRAPTTRTRTSSTAQWELAVVPGRASAAHPHDPLHRGPPGRGASLHGRDRGAPVAGAHHLGQARSGRAVPDGRATPRDPLRGAARDAGGHRPLPDGRGTRSVQRRDARRARPLSVRRRSRNAALSWNSPGACSGSVANLPVAA